MNKIKILIQKIFGRYELINYDVEAWFFKRVLTYSNTDDDNGTLYISAEFPSGVTLFVEIDKDGVVEACTASPKYVFPGTEPRPADEPRDIQTVPINDRAGLMAWLKTNSKRHHPLGRA